MSQELSADLSVDEALTADQQERLAEILDQYLVSIEAGLPATPEDLIARHPELSAELRSYLSGLDLLQDMTAGFDTADANAPVESPGRRRLGDFELLDEIGRGGMGVVYEARQISLDRRVAVKVLPFASILDSKQIARFKNEAHAAAQIHHPHIVPVYAIGQQRGVHYYAMQHIDGQPLDAVIQELRDFSRLPSQLRRREAGLLTASELLQTQLSERPDDFIRSVVHLTIDAACALHAAHEFGIIHRDIKPSNLLLDGQGKVWITDFGLARCQSEANLTRTGDLVGTMRYMSPEQTTGRTFAVDHRADVYSLGITLYELLTLRPAFRGDDGPDLLRRIANEEPPQPRTVCESTPTDLETIVLKAISKARAARYETAEDFAGDLERFLNGLRPLATRPTLGDRVRRWSRRHQQVARVAARFSAIAIIGLLFCMFIVARENAKRQQAIQEADANLMLARQNYTQAREAVDRLGGQLAEKLAHIPDAAAVRQEVLQDTLSYYESFIEQSAGDPNLAVDIAVTYSRMGRIAEQAGRTDQAIEAYLKTKTALEPIAAQAGNAAARSHLALCEANLGLLYLRRDELRLARKSLTRAVVIQSALIDDSPGNPRHLGELALTQNNLGLLLEREGDYAGAEAKFAQAAATQRHLSEEYPHDRKLLRDLAATLNNLSIVTAKTSPNDAIDSAHEAVQIHQRIIRKDPQRLDLRRECALAWNNVGALYSRLEEDDAVASYDQAINELELLCRKSPSVDQYQSDLAVGLNNRGLLQHRLGDVQGASRSFERAMKIQRTLVVAAPGNARRASGLASIENNLGLLFLQLDERESAVKMFTAAIEHQQCAVEYAPQVKRYRKLLETHRRNLTDARRQLDGLHAAATAAVQRRVSWSESE